MKEKAYHEKVNNRNEVHLRELCAKLPVFCKQFFIGNRIDDFFKGPELLMHTIWGFSLSISMRRMQSIRRWKLPTSPYRYSIN